MPRPVTVTGILTIDPTGVSRIVPDNAPGTAGFRLALGSNPIPANAIFQATNFLQGRCGFRNPSRVTVTGEFADPPTDQSVIFIKACPHPIPV